MLEHPSHKILQRALEQGLKASAFDYKREARLGVAISGGADSMALTLLAAQSFGVQGLKAFCVDHGLRHGSAAEARWTKTQLLLLGIDCEILTVDAADLPPGNTQAAARQARYHLIAQACAQARCGILCTAHTLDDQAETVFARLARGSGTKGLAAMQEAAPYPAPVPGFDLTLSRPLLSVRRAALQSYLRAMGQRWVQDPSNADRRYDRIRLRSILASWEDAGFSAERIVASSLNMQRSEAALTHYAQEKLEAMSKMSDGSGIQLDRAAFLHCPLDVQFRIIASSLKRISEKKGDIRLVKLEMAQAKIKQGIDTRFTLHGCLVTVHASVVRFSPEEHS